MSSSSVLRSGLSNYERYLNVLAGSEPYVAPPLSSYDLLATTILSSSQASVTFNSLSTYASTYQHLQIRATLRTTRNTGSADGLSVRLNGDSGSNYSWHRLVGGGSSVSSLAFTSQTAGRLALMSQATSSAGLFAGAVIDILDPFETSKYTTIRSFAGVADLSEVGIYSTLWMNTASLTSFQVFSSEGFNLAQYSRLSLYGLKASA